MSKAIKVVGGVLHEVSKWMGVSPRGAELRGASVFVHYGDSSSPASKTKTNR